MASQHKTTTVEVHRRSETGLWYVWVHGEDKYRSQHNTQKEADIAGREVAKSLRAEYMLKGEDGTIREKDSYGNDPRNIKG